MLYYKMEDKLLDCIKHIKEISKQKVTFDRIISYLKKNEEITNHDEIQQILDKLISENRIEVMKLLNKLLCKPKDRVATEDKNNIVYEIDCSNCQAVYFG